MRRALAVVCLCVLCVFLANCGQSFDLQSIDVSPASPNLEGIGSSQTFTVTAHFSNTKSADVTQRATFVMGKDLDTSTIDPIASGILTLNQNVVQNVLPGCTWTSTSNGSGGYNYGTNPFVLTVTYTDNGVTKQAQAFVSVASTAIPACYDGQSYIHP